MIKKKVSILLILFCFLSFFRVLYLHLNYENVNIKEQKTILGRIVEIKQKEDKTTFIIKNDEKIQITTNKEFNYELGDKVLVNVNIYSPDNNTVFNLFNYKKYLLSKNIVALGKLNNTQLVEKNKNIFYKLKQNIIKRIDNHKSSSYLKTFILGDQSKINYEVKEAYRNLGISHLFSISGMHVGLIVLIINKLLKKFKYKNIIVILFLILFLFITGSPVSLLRCFVFLMLNFLNKKLMLNFKNYYILVVTAFLLLFINPYLIYNVGFLFSTIVTFYILLISKKINKDSYVVKVIKTSSVAFLASLPIIALSFFKLNLISILYNIVFIPIVSFIYFPFSIILIFIPFLDELFLIMINILEEVALFLDNLNFLEVIISKPSYMAVFIYYISLYLSIMLDKKIIIIYIVVLLININSRFFITNPKVIFFDVGQGDSSIIILPKGKVTLIDTGGSFNSSIVKNKIIPYINSIGINGVETVLLSHGDYDHMGEAINLVENFKVEKVIFNCGEFNELEHDLIKVLDKKKIPYYSCIKELNIDNNKLYFLNNNDYGNENDNSSVIYTELNNYKFLFMGDAGIEVEEDLIEKYNLQDIDVLKVGHHGSKTSSSKEFINEITPKYSIISVGKNNRYGHPNKEILENLEKSKIYRTDMQGSIMFKIKNNKLKIETCSP